MQEATNHLPVFLHSPFFVAELLNVQVDTETGEWIFSERGFQYHQKYLQQHGRTTATAPGVKRQFTKAKMQQQGMGGKYPVLGKCNFIFLPIHYDLHWVCFPYTYCWCLCAALPSQFPLCTDA